MGQLVAVSLLTILFLSWFRRGVGLSCMTCSSTDEFNCEKFEKQQKCLLNADKCVTMAITDRKFTVNNTLKIVRNFKKMCGHRMLRCATYCKSRLLSGHSSCSQRCCHGNLCNKSIEKSKRKGGKKKGGKNSEGKNRMLNNSASITNESLAITLLPIIIMNIYVSHTDI